MALQNLVSEFGILSGHLVSVKTESTEGRVAGRHGSLRRFPGEDGFPHSLATSGLCRHVGLRVAGVNLRSGRGLVGFHLAEHFLLLAFLLLKLLALHFHLLALRGGLLRGGLLHLLLLLLRGLLLLLAWSFASSSEPS